MHCHPCNKYAFVCLLIEGGRVVGWSFIVEKYTL